MTAVDGRIYLSPPHMSGREQNNIIEALQSNWVAPIGKQVDAFEKEMTSYTGAKGALALNSGTAALQLALRLAGVGPGDVVFCSSLTFVASANVILYQGAEPVFIDSEPHSWNLSPAALQRALQEAEEKKKLPKALIGVNLYGQSADWDPILKICRDYKVVVVEDAAESLGATYKGKASGTLGKYGVLSFNGNKIITTSAGGMLLSDDLDALKKALFWATQAKEPACHYEHREMGYNYRLSNLLAGLGREQLGLLEERVIARRAVCERYYEALGGIEGIAFMPETSYGRATRWLTALTVDPLKCGVHRDEIIASLDQKNIEARPVWKPMHRQPLFEGCAYFSHKPQESISDTLFGYGLCLPSGSNLSWENQKRVIEGVQNQLKGGRRQFR